MKQLKGILPPITTPFIKGELSIEKLEFNISKWNSTSLSGYVVMGSNGESVLLTRDEKLKLIEAAKKFASEEKLLIAGTGSDSIKETINLTNDSAKLGVDYALVLTPSFYKSEMKHEAFVKYFSLVADSTDIPIIIYNVPKFTGVDIETETVLELSKHQNIAGIKNSTENIRQIIEFVSKTKNEFNVLVGTASMLYSGFTSGAVGGIVALANIAPKETVQIHEFVNQGNLIDALSLQQKMIPINKAVTSKFGVAGLKAAMDLLGYYGGDPRVPLAPLNELNKNILINILKDSGLLNN
ncbi:MAG: dihydrodipicolinate synthase family protein [Ignavibacteria bacterium]|nr:dihydrodipicolinate synthase family protein [Ignavibacteria bacterium]